MKKNSIVIVLLIVSLTSWTLAAAEWGRNIAKMQSSVPYGSSRIALITKRDADDTAGARILKAAQNLRFPPSLPSSPPPFYPPTPTGPQPISPPANPPSPLPKPVIPSKNVPESGVMNPRTGEFYPGTFGGVTNPRTGVFLPKVEGGYLNPETGEVIPKQ